MKKTISIITLLLICIFSLWFCQKKIFKKIEIQGRLVNYITFEPISTDVSLMGVDATTAKDVPHITLDNINSNSNGNFYFKGRASRRGRYYLYIGEESFKYEKSIKVNEGKKTDLGDVPMGNFTFSCQVTLVPVSSSSIDIIPSRGISQPYHFATGTSTVFTHTQTYSVNEYDQSGKKYILGYATYPSGTKTYSHIFMPINSSTPLSVTINY